ncbi:MAG: DUF2892 domain-containing protein [Chitinophagaceae bacterium]|nr:DUF2892 domain-containing protein [Chitinophagaceae bacterium]MCB9045536.1 DUF2892 domain-containing protein [Chitinophagales bacterium]
MNSNMGNIDKLIRIVAAIIIGVLYFTGAVTGTSAIILLAVSAIFLLTSFAGFCPLYYPFKISTKKK